MWTFFPEEPLSDFGYRWMTTFYIPRYQFIFCKLNEYHIVLYQLWPQLRTHQATWQTWCRLCQMNPWLLIWHNWTPIDFWSLFNWFMGNPRVYSKYSNNIRDKADTCDRKSSSFVKQWLIIPFSPLRNRNSVHFPIRKRFFQLIAFTYFVPLIRIL